MKKEVAMGSYSFNWTTITFSESEGQVVATINLEGTAEGLGTVLGTLTARGAGTPSGTYEILAVSFPEAVGEQVTASGSGDWTQVAGDRWTSQGTAVLSRWITRHGTPPDYGDHIKVDGVFLLAERTWSGTFE
jgi:hypothetical protein